jgi:N-acetylglucosaminyldiphosphoundecaprenol N-acetyl-beta-D-mannosaminyltransferase
VRTEIMETGPLQTVMVGGFPTVSVTRKQLADRMAADCLTAREQGDTWLPKLVFSSNGQGIALAGQDAAFAEAMDSADIIHADGMPVVAMSRLTEAPLPERIATTDFFHDAAAAAMANGLKFFILGSTEAQNAKVVEAIARLYPQLQVVGRHHGYFGEDEDEAVCAAIRASGADVLWVGLGKPRQEFWSVRNRHRLAGVGWLKTCGGLYAFLTGEAPRAPDWMQKWGLEWLFRAMGDPRRLGPRYLLTNPYSLYRLVRYTRRAR